MIVTMNNSDLMFIMDRANISESFVNSYLNNKTIFISGGTGFIGKWLVASLKKITELRTVNFDIYILTRNSESFRKRYPELSEGIFFINGPIENEETFKNLDIKFIENQDSFTENEWNELYQLSENTFLEETDSLKQTAAGAGLSDND